MAKKKKKGMMAKIGVWSFILGIVLALIFSIINQKTLPGWSITVLVILGLIVGLLNIKDKEVMLYLVAAVAFILSSIALSAVISIPFINTFLASIVAFTAPGAIVVSFRALYDISKD